MLSFVTSNHEHHLPIHTAYIIVDTGAVRMGGGEVFADCFKTIKRLPHKLGTMNDVRLPLRVFANKLANLNNIPYNLLYQLTNNPHTHYVALRNLYLRTSPNTNLHFYNINFI